MAHDTVIGWREQLSSETRPWSIDMTLAMDPGDAVGAATSTLTDMIDGTDFAAGLLGSPVVVSATNVTQTVTALAPGHRYRLEVLADMGGSKRSAVVLLLAVPY
jgi:hypothetical protein